MSKTLLMFGAMGENQELVADLNPAYAKEFWRIIHLISKTFNVRSFDICGSKLVQSVGHGAIIDLDIKSIVGLNFDMKFSADQKKLRTLKTTTGNFDQIIIHDKSKMSYCITDNINLDWLGCVNESSEKWLPEISQMNVMGHPIILNDAKNLKTRFLKCKEVDLLLYDNQLEQVTDSEQIVNLSGLALTMMRGKNPEIILSSKYFLKIADDSNVELTVAKENESYWLITRFSLGLARGTLYELV
ncbi:hypothetical protein [Solidesulfovibrio magneticus]|nr:hypothetical protein [Solidesulfovibrio magneticus]